ncbi:uncharacterized protein LOC122399675 [Colletes gigas]|uniref:uncharacterized protein LOC122399675 n=1 Tax=Colletes gigas TaxID=935657 RepID=UPI001C9AF384|nr:uncharacterized protein LOC122399675 [Colletes gigas]
MSSSNIEDRERIAKQIARTSDLIRRKYRELKTGKMEEEIALEKHFKPVTEPLKAIANNTLKNYDVHNNTDIGSGPLFTSNIKESDKTQSHLWLNLPKPSQIKKPRLSSLLDVNPMTSTPVSTSIRTVPTIKSSVRLSSLPDMNPMTSIPIKPVPATRSLANEDVFDSPKSLANEDVFESPKSSFSTSVRSRLQTSEGEETLRNHLGPLSQKYIAPVLRGDVEDGMDHVYGVYLDSDGPMLGNKRVDVGNADNIIIDGIRYSGTPGLYELIFKKIPDDNIYTEADERKYRDILLTTSAHKYKHDSYGKTLGNKGYKYNYVIKPLLKDKKVGKGVPSSMRLTSNKIDYVHWNDPNELVDRLRLLEASRQAGHNAHNNEMLSIIEELREAELIIN